MTHAAYDPRYESARATSQSERGWHFPPDAPAEPFDPRDQKATRYGWIIVAVCAVAVIAVTLF